MRVIGITPINNDLKEEKSMKFLQKLGKALMLPVAVLPICGILMGIGYMLCPEAMQGGDIQGAADMIESSPNLCVNSSFSYVVLSTLLLSSKDLTEWSLVYHNTLSYQRFYDLHSIHYDHLEGLHQSVV